MTVGPRNLIPVIFFALLSVISTSNAFPLPAWTGILRDATGKPVAAAKVTLHSTSGNGDYRVATSVSGQFSFSGLPAGTYELSVNFAGKTWRTAKPLIIKDGINLAAGLLLSSPKEALLLVEDQSAASTQASGGEHLSSAEVSSLPLNERDFSKLLLLAAGTMTDTNGAANFTQQFAVNGQRGVAAVFAMDATDTTDPELGCATFSNFNVDAIQEVQSSSGVLPAEIGHGAAGFTNVVTKSGSELVHGSAFEFLRNAAFDAGNFFDHEDALD